MSTISRVGTRLAARANLMLLWLLGVPLPILLLIWLFRH